MNMKYFTYISLTTSISMIMMMTTTMKNKTTMIEWSMMKILATKMEIMLIVDMKSTAFSSCVMIITTAVLMYSNYYMEQSKKKNQFAKLIMMFVMSMMLLIFSPNMISMILGWEGLGMTSFVLIMFYQNKKSINSSFYTMMMNRMGDIMMIMAMISMMEMNSWMFESQMFKPSDTTTLLMMIAAFSKSAQIPFSSWLTEAMAAPTPISALVHSSTLVTAGIFMFIRFETTLKYSKMSKLIMTISIMTLAMASMNSLTEWDIKKIVALSTLSQLSMMFITMAMNLFNLAMFHMLVHATFKALIFLASSSFIAMANTQDIRKMGKLNMNMKMTKMSFNTASMTLSGFPFMSSFYSKEMIMEMMIVKSMNLMMVTMFYMCMAATLFYSIKTAIFINTTKHMTKMIPKKESSEQKKSKIMLMLPAVMYGNKMNWIVNLNQKIPHLENLSKMIPTFMMIIMMLTMTEMMNQKKNSQMKNSTKMWFNNYMWFMKNMSIQIKKSFKTFMITSFINSEKITFNKMITTACKTTKKMSTINFIMTHKNTKMINLMILLSMMVMM